MKKKEKENKRKVIIGYSRETTGNKHINKKYKIVPNDNSLSASMLVILVVPGVLGLQSSWCATCSKIKGDVVLRS